MTGPPQMQRASTRDAVRPTVVVVSGLSGAGKSRPSTRSRTSVFSAWTTCPTALARRPSRSASAAG